MFGRDQERHDEAHEQSRVAAIAFIDRLAQEKDVRTITRESLTRAATLRQARRVHPTLA